jgi:hypothetical protein
MFQDDCKQTKVLFEIEADSKESKVTRLIKIEDCIITNIIYKTKIVCSNNIFVIIGANDQNGKY